MSEGLGGRLWLEPFIPSGTGRTHLPPVGRGLGGLLEDGLYPMSLLSHLQQLEALIEYTPFGLCFFRS